MFDDAEEHRVHGGRQKLLHRKNDRRREGEPLPRHHVQDVVRDAEDQAEVLLQAVPVRHVDRFDRAVAPAQDRPGPGVAVRGGREQTLQVRARRRSAGRRRRGGRAGGREVPGRSQSINRGLEKKTNSALRSCLIVANNFCFSKVTAVRVGHLSERNGHRVSRYARRFQFLRVVFDGTLEVEHGDADSSAFERRRVQRFRAVSFVCVF